MIKTIQLKEILHREKYHIAAFFPYDPEIAKLSKEAGMAYSNTNKCWYIENNRDNYYHLKNIFGGKAILDETELKAAFAARKGKPAIINTQASTSKVIIAKPKVKGKELFMELDDAKRDKIMKFNEWMQQKAYGANSIKTYCEAITIFFAYYKNKSIEEITNNDIVQFNLNYILRRNLSFTYQNQFTCAIKLFYKKIQLKKIEIDGIERALTGRKLPKVIAKNDILQMLKGINNLKHKAALTTIYSCGLRRWELINLKLEHMDSKRKTMTIFNSKGKKDRVLPMSNKLLELIKQYYLACKPKMYLIEGQQSGERYSETSLEKIFHKYLGRVIKNHTFTLHCLRHSYATHLHEAGVDIRYIQELLGHKSSRTTEIYTHVSMKNLQNIKNPIDDFDL